MKQKLTIDQILEKEFHVDFQGYNALEVDEFLDMVMRDYEMFESLILEQKELLDRYEETLTKQKLQIRELQSSERAQKDIEPKASYVDLLRRISKLEDDVYKNK